MKNQARTCLLTVLMASAILATAQDDDHTITDLSGRTYLRPNGYSPAAPSTFAVGTAPTSGYALDVHGEQMNPPLGDVFKTNADKSFASYWRMFHGEDEFGQLFHLVDEKQFNINAPLGHLLFRTNDQWRMRINPKGDYNDLGSFTNVPADGFVGISPNKDFWGNGPGPFSRLHLAEPGDINAQAIGYRPWQRNGVTFTGNGDQGYIGQKYNREDHETDLTDMVIQWSDNPGNWKGDRMRFIFTSQYQPGTHTGMNSEEGLEGMRLFPTLDQGINVGVGDFFAYGGDPTERLHVRDGRVRFQRLPDDIEADMPFKVMVVDDSPIPSAERGVVKWKSSNSIGCSSGWSLNGNNAVTAFNGNPCIPQAPDRVGIGTTGPLGKLHVETDFPTAASSVFGIYNHVNVGNSLVYAIRTIAEASGAALNCGVHSIVQNGTQGAGVLADVTGTSDTWGVKATVSGGSNVNSALYGLATGGNASFGAVGNAQDATENTGFTGAAFNGQKSIGVLAHANNASLFNYGILASASGPSTATNYAGYFAGDVFTTGSYLPSDAMLKTNVENLQGALGVILSLSPKTYDYLTTEYARLHLPEGQQAGLMAQDLATVLPGLVKTTVHPSDIDSSGNPINEQVNFSAVNLTGLIPYLIGAVQEQQATIAQMQAQLDQCCATNPGMAPGGDGSLKSTPAKENVQEQRLVIQPNPFTDHTTLSYYVPQAGKVSLQVSTSDGKPMGTLREEQADAGAYTYEWNTSRLASGTYFCTFMVDGTVVVKRAVKVAR